ncbi:MAG: Bcr/CflA family efflux MFS transporter [Chromatiales bacterium]|nr:MAG: Bcr/CflA family efflux MFS transporter [Chromatiales bacterium]
MQFKAATAPRALIPLLSLASALSPFGMVVVVPTLSEVGRRYGIGSAETQFLISAYLFGLGAAQPFSGLLCDRLGRRPVLLGGFLLFVAASLGCAAIRDIDWLIALRFLQAVGVSVGTVASRAVVRDTHDEEGTAAALAIIAAAMGIAPVIAPVVGGVLGGTAGPQSVFVASALLGVVVLLAVWWRLPETRRAGQTPAVNLQSTLRDYRHLLGSRVFMGYTLMFGFVQGGFFTFLAVGATVFERDLGLGQQTFGLVWGGMAFAYILGASAAGRLTRQMGMNRTIYVGMFFTCVAGWGLLALALTVGISLVPLASLLALLTAASGLVIPGSMAGAVSFRPEIAGTSSGLSSALGLVLSGAFAILSGVIYTGNFTPIALLMAAGATLTAISGWMVRGAAASEAGEG